MGRPKRRFSLMSIIGDIEHILNKVYPLPLDKQHQNNHLANVLVSLLEQWIDKEVDKTTKDKPDNNISYQYGFTNGMNHVRNMLRNNFIDFYSFKDYCLERKKE